MPVNIEDRPLEQVREQVIDQLIFNYSHAVISADAFERRLDQAMEATNNKTLMELVSDLELTIDKNYQSEKASQFVYNYSRSSNNESLKLRNILGSNERSGQWVVPKTIELTNVMGSLSLDFTDAIFTHQHVTIYVNCIMGNDEIFVPEHVNVVSKLFSVMGSIENSSVTLPKLQGPTISIEGRVIMGQVDIKIKRTIKEKFVSFAHTLRTTWDELNSPPK